ncbi:hypothetical protein [Hafnia sp. HMSC23F03]|nr:hypothetical protein [Hafnia sp. HMSC23F03]
MPSGSSAMAQLPFPAPLVGITVVKPAVERQRLGLVAKKETVVVTGFF